jgi:hypothetical protein
MQNFIKLKKNSLKISKISTKKIKNFFNKTISEFQTFQQKNKKYEFFVAEM